MLAPIRNASIAICIAAAGLSVSATAQTYWAQRVPLVAQKGQAPKLIKIQERICTLEEVNEQAYCNGNCDNAYADAQLSCDYLPGGLTGPSGASCQNHAQNDLANCYQACTRLCTGHY